MEEANPRRRAMKKARTYHFGVVVRRPKSLNVKEGFATVCITRMDGEILAGVAWCSPRDHFNRARGRFMAIRRLSEFSRGQTRPPYTTILKAEPGKAVLKVAEKVLQTQVREGESPQWAKGDVVFYPKIRKRKRLRERFREHWVGPIMEENEV